MTLYFHDLDGGRAHAPSVIACASAADRRERGNPLFARGLLRAGFDTCILHEVATPVNELECITRFHACIPQRDWLLDRTAAARV